MNKEILRFVRPIAFIPAAGIVAATIVLARSDKDSGHVVPQDQLTKPDTQEFHLPGGLPSEENLKDKVRLNRNLADIISYLKSFEDKGVLVQATKLNDLHLRGRIYATTQLQPEETKFDAPTGRFPGTLVEWSSTGLRIGVPKDLLTDPKVSEADLAMILDTNLRFAETLVNQFGNSPTFPTADEVQELFTTAKLTTERELRPTLLSQ